MDVWQQVGVAIALVLIIEGMIPFIAPDRWRNMVESIAGLDNRVVRGVGLASMVLGLVLLYLVN